jgi:hypothetical protein
MDATEIFERKLSERLTLPDGNKRRFTVMPIGDLINICERMLAYVSPWYMRTREDPLPPIGDPSSNVLT